MEYTKEWTTKQESIARISYMPYLWIWIAFKNLKWGKTQSQCQSGFFLEMLVRRNPNKSIWLPNISGCGQISENFKFQDLDVRRIGASDEEVPEVRLEHAGTRPGSTVARHRRDTVQNNCLKKKNLHLQEEWLTEVHSLLLIYYELWHLRNENKTSDWPELRDATWVVWSWLWPRLESRALEHSDETTGRSPSPRLHFDSENKSKIF